MFKKDIIENNFTLSSYDTFRDVDKAKFKNLAKKKRKNVYKIDLKNTIPQYILVENDKIISFFETLISPTILKHGYFWSKTDSMKNNKY